MLHEYHLSTFHFCSRIFYYLVTIFIYFVNLNSFLKTAFGDRINWTVLQLCFATLPFWF